MKNIKNIVVFILFITYTVSVFLIKNYTILGICAIFNIVLMLVIRINLKEAAKNLLKIAPFILFTAVINVILMNINEGILVTVRLLIVCNATYIFSKIMSTLELTKVIEILAYPVKIFKIDPRDIAIIVSIAISFISVITQEITNIKYSLKSKGFNINSKNMILHANLILNPLFLSLLNRVNEMEYAMKSKAYIE